MSATDIWLSLRGHPVLQQLAANVTADILRIEDCTDRAMDSIDMERGKTDWALPYVESQLLHAKRGVEALKSNLCALIDEIVKTLP